MKKRISVANLIIGGVILLMAVACIVPMLYVISVSFTDELTISRYGYRLIPKKVSLDAYKYLFGPGSTVGRSYAITIFVTIVGTIGALLITMTCAYALSRKKVKYRDQLSLFFYFASLFNAGLVPWYMMCTNLGLRDNLFALIVPSLLFNPFNMYLAKNFMAGIPDSLMESAQIDGARDVTIALRIYFPICKPIIATLALYYGLAYWNDWMNAVMLVDNTALYPLQYLLVVLRSNIQALQEASTGADIGIVVPTESVKMATTLITIGPIVFFYPFLQKYFVKGITIGSVKG